jgi:hypothetical protein
MQIRAEEISELIRKQIEEFEASVKLDETGIVITLLVYPLLPRTSLHSITWNQQHSDGI